jgi:hypothetical protein
VTASRNARRACRRAARALARRDIAQALTGLLAEGFVPSVRLDPEESAAYGEQVRAILRVVQAPRRRESAK